LKPKKSVLLSTNPCTLISVYNTGFKVSTIFEVVESIMLWRKLALIPIFKELMCMDVHHITHSVVVLTLSTYGPPWYLVTINNKFISRRISISCVYDIGDSNILDDKWLDYTRYCIYGHRLYLYFLVSIGNHPCSHQHEM
jgi:hypothetical protein